MLSVFGADGTHTITSGVMFDETSTELSCVISDELAMYNGIAAGDKMTLANPKDPDETYTLTVSGIYTNTASDSEDSRFSILDPANNIYMNTAAPGVMLENSAQNDPDTAMTAQTTFTYVFPAPAGLLFY